MSKQKRFKSTMPEIKETSKAYKEEICSFCGWQRQHHGVSGQCYHFSDENSDYFYKDRFFKPKQK